MNQEFPISESANSQSSSTALDSISNKKNLNQYARLPDRILVIYVVLGNNQAFSELYHRHLDELYRYIYYRSANNQSDTEDLTQEVFLRAWKFINKKKLLGKKASNFRSLLYKIAHNLTIDQWRTQKSAVHIDERIENSYADLKNSVEQSIINREKLDSLQKAVRELPPQQRDVFICRYINNLSHAETANLLGLKKNHVWVLQHRALKKIKIRV